MNGEAPTQRPFPEHLIATRDGILGEVATRHAAGELDDLDEMLAGIASGPEALQSYVDARASSH